MAKEKLIYQTKIDNKTDLHVTWQAPRYEEELEQAAEIGNCMFSNMDFILESLGVDHATDRIKLRAQYLTTGRRGLVYRIDLDASKKNRRSTVVYVSHPESTDTSEEFEALREISTAFTTRLPENLANQYKIVQPNILSKVVDSDGETRSVFSMNTLENISGIYFYPVVTDMVAPDNLKKVGFPVISTYDNHKKNKDKSFERQLIIRDELNRRLAEAVLFDGMTGKSYDQYRILCKQILSEINDNYATNTTHEIVRLYALIHILTGKMPLEMNLNSGDVVAKFDKDLKIRSLVLTATQGPLTPISQDQWVSFMSNYYVNVNRDNIRPQPFAILDKKDLEQTYSEMKQASEN